MSTHSPYMNDPQYTAPPQEMETTEVIPSFKRISWGAVFSGVVLAIGIQLLLSMLGTGIGFSTIDPLEGNSPELGTIGISAGIWWTLSNLIALFAGGWIAGYLAGIPRRLDGVIHGVLTWSLSTILALAVLGTALGSLLVGTMQVIAPQVAGVARDAGSNMQGLRDEAWQILERGATGNASGAAANVSQQEINAMLDRLFQGGDAGTANRQEVIQTLQDRAGMSREEADRMVTQWTDIHNRLTGPEARAAADKTAQTVARASLWSFGAMFLGAVAAIVGGMSGIPQKRAVYARTTTTGTRRVESPRVP